MVESDRALKYREKAACEPAALNLLYSLDFKFLCRASSLLNHGGWFEILG